MQLQNKITSHLARYVLHTGLLFCKRARPPKNLNTNAKEAADSTRKSQDRLHATEPKSLAWPWRGNPTRSGAGRAPSLLVITSFFSFVTLFFSKAFPHSLAKMPTRGIFPARSGVRLFHIRFAHLFTGSLNARTVAFCNRRFYTFLKNGGLLRRPPSILFLLKVPYFSKGFVGLSPSCFFHCRKLYFLHGKNKLIKS